MSKNQKETQINYWPGTQELLKTAKQVVKILNISYNSLLKLVHEGNIEFTRVGKNSIHFTYDQVSRFIETSRTEVRLPD
jgi:excisionase family DNA binding protein